ncbi:hypothetical protein EJ04DRAFT_546680 [Polyplosphaeria fusca]|uniref:Glycosyl transferase CAP10 domain-containing protein n=1 Tax=Polyplosphaeria fusca TaxID=682080 RepID=A0A9P4UX67_9PLEO|nr:hypothetical protein EJ04DRAFT_546680 [Polyplosphaeria fusca]
MHAKAAFLRPSWRTLQLLALVSVVLCVIVVYESYWGIPSASWPRLPSWGGVGGWDNAHPIDVLIADAAKGFKQALSSEAKSLEDAANKYRERRRRHPPPGFDAWYHFASEKGAVIVEDFWDQIYDDLGPFWSLESHTLRQQAHAFTPRIEIRDGNITMRKMGPHVRLDQWTDMLKTLLDQKHVQLPDLDIPLLVYEEPALIVPWQTIDTAMSFARPIPPAPADVALEYTGIEGVENAGFSFDPEWLGARRVHPAKANEGERPYWSLVRPACHPKSAAQQEPLLRDIWDVHEHTDEEHSAVNMLPIVFPDGTLQGYVKNWSVATDACKYSHLQGLHGAFVAPEDLNACVKMWPLFGASKFSMNNDILLPSPSAWNLSLASAEEYPPVNWSQRENKLFWRGPATGGLSDDNNWRRFHRHRFVSMMNASEVNMAEPLPRWGRNSSIGVSRSETFLLTDENPYQLANNGGNTLGSWVKSWADVAFTDLHCSEMIADGSCPYDEDFYRVDNTVDDDKFQQYKYTVALDGNGGDDGGELIERMRGGTVVLRASVYRNWYDNRLWPWVHFVPMDNTFMDVYGIMEYFLGTRGPALLQDAAARRIATAAHSWAEKVLRKDDMLIYVYRLVLEYARVVDNRRERLGWVADLDEEGRT